MDLAVAYNFGGVSVPAADFIRCSAIHTLAFSDLRIKYPFSRTTSKRSLCCYANAQYATAVLYANCRSIFRVEEVVCRGKEVCHVEMALCTKWIIMLAFYAQHVKKKREAELTFGIAGSTVDGNGDICNVCLLCGHRISPSICLVISRNKKKGYIIADIAKKVFPRVSIEFPKLYAYTQISNRKKL